MGLLYLCFYVPVYYVMTSYTHISFLLRMVTYCILAAQNIQYTLELLTEFFNCISYFNMKFKPFIVKNVVFLYLGICSQNFCNVTIYPPFVTHLPEDGRKSGRNMYDEYCFCNIRCVHTFTCIFLVPLPYLRFEYFVERNCYYYFATERLFIRIPLDLLEGGYSTPFGFSTYDQMFRTYPISNLASTCILFS